MVNKAQIPNLLCVARIALIIPLWAIWSSKPVPSAYIFIFGVFVLAALTDWLDGVCARKWQVQSPLGAMLDQIADKLLMVSIFVILTYDHLLPATLTVLLILREVWVSGVREYVGSQNKELPVSKLGKWKTALQMIGVGGLLCSMAGFAYYGAQPTWPLRELFSYSIYVLWATAALAWVSAFQYSKALWR